MEVEDGAEHGGDSTGGPGSPRTACHTAPVLHTRLVVHRLVVDGDELPLRFATVVAVARAESAQLDWEVVAEGSTDASVEHGRHRLGMTCITGAEADGRLTFGELSGDAVVVRVVGRTVVLRGDGRLEGLDVAQLGG